MSFDTLRFVEDQFEFNGVCLMLNYKCYHSVFTEDKIENFCRTYYISDIPIYIYRFSNFVETLAP